MTIEFIKDDTAYAELLLRTIKAVCKADMYAEDKRSLLRDLGLMLFMHNNPAGIVLPSKGGESAEQAKTR